MKIIKKIMWKIYKYHMIKERIKAYPCEPLQDLLDVECMLRRKAMDPLEGLYSFKKIKN